MYLQELSEKVWITKNARFLASKRMNRSRKSSVTSVALLSASIIAVNMLVFFDQGKVYSTTITVVTVILSTFSLVMSLLITHMRYEYREDNYHQCGLELENLNQRLRLKISEIIQANGGREDIESPMDENEKFLSEYNDILKKYNLNHTDFDYKYSKWKANDNEDCKFNIVCYWLRWNVFDVYMIYWMIALVPLAILASLLYKFGAQC